MYHLVIIALGSFVERHRAGNKVAAFPFSFMSFIKESFIKPLNNIFISTPLEPRRLLSLLIPLTNTSIY